MASILASIDLDNYGGTIDKLKGCDSIRYFETQFKFLKLYFGKLNFINDDSVIKAVNLYYVI